MGVLLAAVISVGFLYYRYQAPAIMHGISRQLISIAELQSTAISNWRIERLSDAHFYQNNHSFLVLAKARIANPEATIQTDPLAEWLSQTQASHGYEILLLNAEGQRVLCTPSTLAPPSANELAGVGRLSFADAPAWVDFHRLNATGDIRLTLIVPLRDPDQPALLMGFMLWRLNPTNDFYQALQAWPLPTVSGESALLSQYGDRLVYIYPLHQEPNAALNLNVSETEAKGSLSKAFSAHTDLVEGTNSRGDSVFAILKPVAGSQWILKVSIGQNEALIPLWQLRWATSLTVGALLLSILSISGYIWRSSKLRNIRILEGANAKLAESEERLRLALASSGQAIYDVNLTTGEIEITREYALMLGYEPEGFYETFAQWAQRLHPEDCAHTQAHYLDYTSGRRPDYDVEFRIRTKSGAWIWIHSRAKIVTRKPDGSPLRLLGILTDITARKTTAAALEASEARYRALFHESSATMLLIRADTGAILEANRAAASYYGWTHTELERMNISEINTLSPAEVQAEMARAHAKHQSHFFFRHRLAGGLIRDVQVFSGPVEVNGSPCLISIIHDVTDRLRAEAALAEREAIFSTIVNQAVDSIGLVDSANGMFIEFNHAAHANLGYSREEFARMGVFDIEAGQNPEEIKATFVRMSERDGAVIESVHRHRTGRLIEVRISARPVFVAGRHCFAAIWTDISESNTARRKLTEAIQEKESLLKEVHHRVKNNLQVIASLLRLESARDSSGRSKVPLQEMQNRIRSMALLHETIYRSGNLAQVDLAVYLRQLTTQLFRAHISRPTDIHLHLELTSVLLDLDQAIPCGLIVNELVSNCLKHGFPANRAGEVRLAVQQPAPDAPLRLRVADTGVGLPPDFNLNQCQSLGLHLVADLTRQLRGELVIEPGPGAGFAITFLPQAATRA